MKSNLKRFLALLLAVVLTSSMLYVPANASAFDKLETKSAEVELDGTNPATATVSIITNDYVEVYGIEGSWDVHENENSQYLTLTAISSEILEFKDMNYADAASGRVMWTDDNFEGLCIMDAGEKFLKATYTVAADTPAGEYTVRFRSDVYTDNEEYFPDETVTYYTAKITVTTASAPTCDHEGKEYTYEPNNNGTHKVKCECGEYKTENEGCSGGSATCEAKAKCSKCDVTYGNFADHNYGELIPAVAEKHTQDELKAGVAAHYICSECGKYFTEGKAETTLSDLTGKTPEHAEDPNKTTTETTPATCTTEGSTVTITFCSCGYQLSKTSTPIPAGSNCILGTATYTWSSDNATCTAEIACQYGTAHKTETVSTTNEVTTIGTCIAEEVITYYADFSDDWTDQTKEVTGENDIGNHVGPFSYQEYNDDKHLKKCEGCTNPVGLEEHKYVDGKCICKDLQQFILTVENNIPELLGNSYNYMTVEDNYKKPEDLLAYVYNGYTLPELYHFVEFTYENGEKVEFPFQYPAKNLTIVAKFEVNTYVMHVQDLAGSEWDINVPYGANFMDYIPAEANTDKVYHNDPTYKIGVDNFIGWSVYDSKGEYVGTTMPAEKLDVMAAYIRFIGWYSSDEGENWVYNDGNGHLEGWQQINHADYLEDGTGSDWYYFDENTSYRAEGLTRVPYPTAAINGITYKADQDALDYCASKGTTFIDAGEAWFLFGEDGKFQSSTTGKGTYNGATRWIENGHLAWHPGMEKVDDLYYYYFIGDEINGGNKMATGDVYVKYNNTARAFVIDGIYTFADNGALCEYDGITEVGGKLRYYKNAQLMAGNGLTKVDENYIYVRSNGELVVNAAYYVPANSLGVAAGTYSFDENGYMIDPVSAEKNGVYYENGAWYYYENGKIGYNKGLINTLKKWYDADGKPCWGEGGIIYVRSNGQLATGTYYVTNLANYDDIVNVAQGQKCEFDDMGILNARALMKNGIVEENGSLYYYVNGVLQYNAGVIELDGKYYYVRSNGEVVNGKSYWITNVGETGVVAKKYTFAADGSFTPEFAADQKNGIVDGYYYVDGKIAYGAGLVQLSDENGVYLIYVRSNGQLATGIYWPTNKNGIDVAGSLDFGTDGKCYIG